MSKIKDSFNSTDSSPEWKLVYKEMFEGYYLKVGIPARQPSTLQSQFVKLYSGFKNGIRGLSLVAGAPKCPDKYVEDDVSVNNFIVSLHSFLSSNKKVPKKWWSVEVVRVLLQLHLTYAKDYGT